MRIALTGEGPTDYGKRDYNTKEWIEGPIQQYAHKIAKSVTEEKIEFQVLEKEEIKKVRVQQRNLKGMEGMSIPARKFAILMKQQKLQKGIFYCDADRSGGKKNNDQEMRKRFRQVYAEVAKGLEETEAIPAVALSMIECWILGDYNALETVFGITIPKSCVLNKPELIWGDKKNPQSDYPKNYLKRMISNTEKRYKDFEGNQEDFCEVARSVNIKTLCESCDISFKQFYDDLCKMIHT